MEMSLREDTMKSWRDLLLKEAKPFTSKREVNWNKVKLCGFGLLGAVIMGIIFYPSSRPEQEVFYEKAESGTISSVGVTDNDPTLATVKQIQGSQINSASVHSSLDHLYKPDTPVIHGGGGVSSSGDRNGSMIVTRGGADTKDQLTAGTRISIELSHDVTISGQAIPIIGYVAKDVLAENVSAIPRGAKVLGEASFDEASERASIVWRSIILPDGIERPLSAIGIGRDGQIGVEGKVYSEGVKNAVGQTLTRFVGAYASGSLKTGAFGENKGGHANGMRNAVAQTATDRANAMGEALQKERKWIEVSGGTQTLAVISQSFNYGHEGGANGR